ncbi:MAG: IS110 family transposase [Caulobacteraceae bacterium]
MTMPYFVGLDASKRTTKICVLDGEGNVAKEGVVDSDPKAIVAFLRVEGRRYARVGMESWSLAPWLYVGLARAGLPIICIETRHSSAVLKAARANKTDRNDARGIAEIMRAGVYKTVHIKTIESQRIRAVLTVRKVLRIKRIDIENVIRGTLLVFGAKLSSGGARTTYERRVRQSVGGDLHVDAAIAPLIKVWKSLHDEIGALDLFLGGLAHADPVCRRLMTAPGIGPLGALAFRAGVDEPNRFRRSRDVAAHFGLTPRSNQSGEHDRRGSITRRGDVLVRSALYVAASTQFRRRSRPCWLGAWGAAVASRSGRNKAIVAVARRLAVILHRMWLTDTDFRWSPEAV